MAKFQVATITDRMHAAIEKAIPNAQIEIDRNGSHFSVRVVAGDFAGKTLVQKQRMVYSAIKPFMAGNDAPVHAIDKLETLLPEDVA